MNWIPLVQCTSFTARARADVFSFHKNGITVRKFWAKPCQKEWEQTITPKEQEKQNELNPLAAIRRASYTLRTCVSCILHIVEMIFNGSKKPSQRKWCSLNHEWIYSTKLVKTISSVIIINNVLCVSYTRYEHCSIHWNAFCFQVPFDLPIHLCLSILIFPRNKKDLIRINKQILH